VDAAVSMQRRGQALLEDQQRSGRPSRVLTVPRMFHCQSPTAAQGRTPSDMIEIRPTW
jgi:hypothetical protein